MDVIKFEEQGIMTKFKDNTAGMINIKGSIQLINFERFQVGVEIQTMTNKYC